MCSSERLARLMTGSKYKLVGTLQHTMHQIEQLSGKLHISQERSLSEPQTKALVGIAITRQHWNDC